MPMESLPLRDIHLPNPIGWWPLAPGWWGLGVTLLVLVAGLIAWFRHRRRQTPIKSALAELAWIEADASMDPAQKIQALSILMKRTAISLKGRETVAGLTGDEWVSWLDNVWPDERRFSQGPGQWLLEGPYRPDFDFSELSQIITLCNEWLKQAGQQSRRKTPERHPEGRRRSLFGRS